MNTLSNDILFSSLDQLPVGIIIIDEQQRLVFFNQWICDYSGFVLEQEKDKNLADIFTEYSNSRLSDACENALLFGLPTRLSHTFNPSPLPLYQKNAVGDENYRIQQQISIKSIATQTKQRLCQIVIDNVTHAVKKEITLKNLADENKEQQKKAEVANKSKSQFLANMSHEIRTPINGVLGMLTLMADTELNDEQKEFNHLATISAENLLHLINDILDVSKIEAGKLDIELVEFSLLDLLTDVISTFSVKAKDKNIALPLDVRDVIYPNMIGDPTRIRQIIINLLGNAIKFTNHGEVEIKAEVIQAEHLDLILKVSITDSGIGISTEKCSQLFDAFIQADSSTTREYGGTGLGLTIVKQLCQLMGGDIEVSSEEGKGSVFCFHLKLQSIDGNIVKSEVEQDINKSLSALPIKLSANKPESNIDILDKSQVEQENLKILLVEDNRINQKVALGLLKKLGYHADVAFNGIQALELLAGCNINEPYQLVLMDCQMPEMDGYQATEQIRDNKAGLGHHNVIIIAMTANSMKGDREKCLSAGMDDYLTKPINPLLFSEKITLWLNKA